MAYWQVERNRYENSRTFVDVVNAVTPDQSAANSEIVLRNNTLNRDGKAIHVANISRRCRWPEGMDAG